MRSLQSSEDRLTRELCLAYNECVVYYRSEWNPCFVMPGLRTYLLLSDFSCHSFKSQLYMARVGYSRPWLISDVLEDS